MKLGDVVMLKGGGWPMTIGLLGNDKAHCTFFTYDTNVSSGWYDLALLELTNKRFVFDEARSVFIVKEVVS